MNETKNESLDSALKYVYAKNTRRVWFVAALIFVGIFISNNSVQPKRTLEVPLSRQLIEYNSPKEVQITTPPPRTEHMDGFRSLKQD